MKKKKILLLLPTGMTVRNFLTTNVLKEMLLDKDLVIFCAVNNIDLYSSYLHHERLNYIQFHKKSVWSFSNILLLILRRRFYEINPNKTLESLKEAPLWSNFYSNLASFLVYPFPRSRLIFNFFKKLLDFTYFPLKAIDNQLNEIEPDLIFSTHLVARDEFDYLTSSYRKKIRTLGMVKSFDNLTGKGFLPFKTDFVLVWNKILKNELINIYDYDDKAIAITGVPQFDIYKVKPDIPRSKFMDLNNLDPIKKTILFATNHKDISPDDPKNIEFLSKELHKMEAQMIVRVHQMDDMNRYKNSYENIVFHVPGVEMGHNSHARVSHKDFLNTLRDQLYYSNIVINTASTMSLDAIASEKSVINIGYDLDEKNHLQSVKRYYDFEHYKFILDSKGTSFANSKEELLVLIEHYLSNQDLTKDGRMKVSETMLAGNTGNASKVVSQKVLKLLKEGLFVT